MQDIIRRDEWLNHPNYLEQQSKIKLLMVKKADYQESFDKTIDEFLRKYYPRLMEKGDFDMKRARMLCLVWLFKTLLIQINKISGLACSIC